MARAPRFSARWKVTAEFWRRRFDPTADTRNSLYAPGGGTKGGFSAETIARGDHFFKMKGNEVFKLAVRSMSDISKQVLCEAGLTTEDVNLFIPHQANQRITDAVANMLKVDPALVYSNISQHGNTSSASIPIGLDECVKPVASSKTTLC